MKRWILPIMAALILAFPGMGRAGEGCPNGGFKGAPGLMRRAAMGYPAAQYQLACRYLFGPGQRNAQDAYFWMHNAADVGYGDAQFMVAYMADQGIGMEKNPQAAQAWLKLAAKNGNSPAKKVLGGHSFKQFLTLGGN